VLVPTVPVWVAILGWLLGGLGIGIAYASISLAVLREAPEGQEGSSAASMQLSETLGIAFGAGLGGVAVAAAAAAGWPAQVGLGAAFALAAAAASIGLVAARRLTETRPTPGPSGPSGSL
jgi:MFS family permease